MGKHRTRLSRAVLKNFFNELKKPSMFGRTSVFKIHTLQSVSDMDILFYLEHSVSPFLFTSDPHYEIMSAQPIMTSWRPLGLVSCLYTGLHVLSQTTDFKNFQRKGYTYPFSVHSICQAPYLLISGNIIGK